MNQERLLKVILSPHVSEKSEMNKMYNQYTFKVLKTSTKLEIKKAVELLFEVKVSRVSVLNVKPKTKRFAKTLGQRKAWKKAVITLVDGHEIEMASA